MNFEQDFECITIVHDGIEHDVFAGGAGPPVILMHELDGLGDACIALAENLATQFRVYVPRFFGRVRQKPGVTGSMKGMWYLCVRREFVAFSKGKTSPVVRWVRKLAQYAHEQSPDRHRVGVVGMCLSGGIVLATVAEASVGAGVAAQPSLPLALRHCSTAATRRDLGVSQSDVDETVASGTPILTLRFAGDKICPIERIEAINNRIPNSQPPPDCLDGSHEHPTLTALYREGVSDEDKQKSHQAIQATIAFLNEHIRTP